MDPLVDKSSTIVIGKPHKKVVPPAEKQPDIHTQPNISDSTEISEGEAYINGQVGRALDNVIHTGLQKVITPDNKNTEKSTVDVDQVIKNSPETQENKQVAKTETTGTENKSVPSKRVKTTLIVGEDGNPIEYDEPSLPQTATKPVDTNPSLKSSYDLVIERNYQLPSEDSSIPDNTKISTDAAADTNNTATAVQTKDTNTNQSIKTVAVTTYIYGDASSKEGFAVTTKINGEPILASNMNGTQQYRLSIIPEATDKGQQIPIFQFEDENQQTHKLNPLTLKCSVSDGKTTKQYDAECNHYFSYQDNRSKDNFTIAASRDGKNCFAINMSTGKNHEIAQGIKETKDGKRFPTLQFQDEKGLTHKFDTQTLEVTIEEAKNATADTTEEKTKDTNKELKENNTAKAASDNEKQTNEVAAEKVEQEDVHPENIQNESREDSPLTVYRKNLADTIDSSSQGTQKQISLLAAEAQLTAKSQGLSPETGKVLFPALILRDAKKGVIKDQNVISSAERLLNAHKMDAQGTKKETWNQMQAAMRWTTTPEQQAQLTQVWNAIQMQQQMMPGMDPHNEFAKELAANAHMYGMPAVGESAAKYLEADQAHKVAEYYSSKNNTSTQKEASSLLDSMKRLWHGDTRWQGKDTWRTSSQQWNNLPPGMTPEMADYTGYGGYNDYNNSMYDMSPLDRQMSPNMRNMHGPHCGNIMPHHNESMWKNPLVWMMLLQTGGSLMLPLMLMGRGGFGMGSMLPFLFM